MAIEQFDGITPVLGDGAWVHASAQVIGDVFLRSNSSIWPGAVLRGDVNHIQIGHDSNVQDCSVLHVTHKRPDDPEGAPLIIGDRVTIGHAVILHGCTIGNEVLVGMGTIILDRVVVEDRVMIGAGSLVPQGKVLESGYLYLGRPVKQVRPLTEEELAHFNYSAAHYVRLMKKYRDQPATS
ncbi:gamma carbonic anhydrase family protein [Jeongeupia naejangsanensis]|uniref:Gamma carbonic anhydrase family protein n=1 Tax=Jeongeupia naejangsanensis TaxID=613195 RepID=A0ABS2BMW0_9NEIS|nr:gamma carbonic anhydrase family protein [Jeongeupia naejangsanensis]MBM3116972.1 gamma carbonic anhydrase family protein [Jeongeupia naejangsanensis]